jgi:hypothetical protein
MNQFLNKNGELLNNSGEEIILATLFVIYLVMGYPLPYNVSIFLNGLFGKIFVISICLILFVLANPIVSVLGVLVAFDLLVKANANAESPINTDLLYETNQNIVEMQTESLEHDIVRKMAPIPYL